jgi:hypothetical protein
MGKIKLTVNGYDHVKNLAEEAFEDAQNYFAAEGTDILDMPDYVPGAPAFPFVEDYSAGFDVEDGLNVSESELYRIYLKAYNDSYKHIFRREERKRSDTAVATQIY